MLEQEITYAAAAIARAIEAMGYTAPAKMAPFKPQVREGQWILGTPVANQVAKAAGVPAAEVAAEIATRLRDEGHFADVQAANGYVNCVLDLGTVATSVVRGVFTTGAAYGQHLPHPERVMIEYGALNTHKEVHVGHLRNLALGAALVRIMRAAGFTVVPSAYIGDIGLHVIKTLWCYREFHRGEEPAGRDERGAWLGELYVESNQRLDFRKDVIAFVERVLSDIPAIRESGTTDAMLRRLVARGMSEDIAHLMGVLASNKPFAPEVETFRNPGTMPAFWEMIGQEVREALRRETVRQTGGTEPPADSPLVELGELFAQLDAHFAEWWEPSLSWEAEMRGVFRQWDTKDPATVALWETTRQWSLDYLAAIYARLDLPIEIYFYESAVEEPGREIVTDLLERGIAEISNGLPVVKIDEKLGLTKETYRVLPILRSDGTTLYSTKDLYLAQLKFAQYGVDRSVYVVDATQSFYFQQIFKILELMGWPQAKQCYHLSYAFVRLPEGKMSSRTGNVVLFDDLEAEVISRARAAVDEKNPELPPEVKESVALAIGHGALIYGMLDRDNNKEIVFEWERALSFDGHAAPYIQYAHARASRILERAAAEHLVLPDATVSLAMTDPAAEELALLQRIGDYPAEVRRAAEEYSPLVVSNYVYELAKLFADFYNACPVLQAEEPTRTTRLALVAATRQTLANGLALLGIAAPDAM